MERLSLCSRYKFFPLKTIKNMCQITCCEFFVCSEAKAGKLWKLIKRKINDISTQPTFFSIILSLTLFGGVGESISTKDGIEL